MDSALLGIAGFTVLLILIILGIPVAVSLLVTGIVGCILLNGAKPSFAILIRQSFRYATQYDFIAVPLFLLMGYAAMHAGLTKKAYASARIWLSSFPGALAMATATASGILGACMGSGIPALAAMSRIAIPEMLHYKYDKGLASGSVAACSSIAILIPPSIVLVIYAVFTEISLGKLLLAGYLPGVFSIFLMVVMIGLRVKFNSELAPPISSEVITWRKRTEAAKGLWGVGILFIILLGGIYSGVFTATEVAALGCVTAFILMFITKNFNWANLRNSFLETMEVTAMTLLLLISAAVFAVFIGLTGLPNTMTTLIVNANLPFYLFLFMLVILFLALGCFLPSISMLLITMPILLPVLEALGINIIWFGIIFVKLAEIGGITPPFGIGVYVVKGVVRDDIPLTTIFRGVAWFVGVELLTTAFLIAFPAISLWLPNSMRGN